MNWPWTLGSGRFGSGFAQESELRPGLPASDSPVCVTWTFMQAPRNIAGSQGWVMQPVRPR